jgi:hypothetical protein
VSEFPPLVCMVWFTQRIAVSTSSLAIRLRSCVSGEMSHAAVDNTTVGMCSVCQDGTFSVATNAQRCSLCPESVRSVDGFVLCVGVW